MGKFQGAHHRDFGQSVVRKGGEWRCSHGLGLCSVPGLEEYGERSYDPILRGGCVFRSAATAQGLKFGWFPFTVPLPQAPTNCFARGEIITRTLDHLDGLASVVLSGAVGIRKTTIALTILHYDRVKARFGGSRYFIHCNDLANSLESFLERLSDAIELPPTRSVEELRRNLTPIPPLLLVLDGMECILDPLAKESKEIHTAIEEISQYKGVQLLATS